MEKNQTIIINPLEDLGKLKALASEQRVLILNALRKTTLNVNELAGVLGMPQSSVATNVGILEEAGLVMAEKMNGKKGSQKRCAASFQELLVRFPEEEASGKDDAVTVEMPIGIFTNCAVRPPCGLCSTDGIIGYLDTPESFLEPERLKAGLLWMGSGFVEYQFPNNARTDGRTLRRLEVAVELSSETPGTNKNWLSDITMWLNNVEIGSWTSPGDFGDRRGALTPAWWKLEGSQYGLLKHWIVTDEGSFVDGTPVSAVRLADLCLHEHSSIRMKLGVKDDARHLGGMNIFGRGFGNYGQGIILRCCF